MKYLLLFLFIFGFASEAYALGGTFTQLATDSAAFINTDVKAGVLQVGGAIIALAGVALGIRWIKATFF